MLWNAPAFPGFVTGLSRRSLPLLLAGYFTLQLGTGNILVHAEEGWFVVGAGRSSVEYSILLIVILLVIPYVDRAGYTS